MTEDIVIPRERGGLMLGLELAALTLCCLYSILSWLTLLQIQNDSAMYLSAAFNLIKSGNIFIFANWPSHELIPEISRLTEFPPGYPAFLALFGLALKDPVNAAAAANATVIALFYAALFLTLYELRAPRPLRVFTYAAFTFLKTFTILFAGLWSENLFNALLLGLTFFSIRIIRGGGAPSWTASCAMLFAASLTRLMGLFNIGLILVPVLRLRPLKNLLVKGGLCALSAAAPILIVFLNNYMIYGKPTQTHRLGQEAFRFDNLLHPFAFTWKYFPVDPGLKIGLFALLAALLAFPFLERKRAPKEDITIHLTLVTGAAVHFLLVYAATLLSNENDLEHRYLAPTILLLILALVSGLKFLAARLLSLDPAKAFWRGALFAAPVAYLIHCAPLVFQLDLTHMPRLNRPAEEALWKELNAREDLKKAALFYSDYNHRHEIFAGKIQQIMYWPRQVTQALDQTRNAADSPRFFVIETSNGQYLDMLDTAAAQGLLTRENLPGLPFVLYTVRPASQKIPDPTPAPPAPLPDQGAAPPSPPPGQGGSTPLEPPPGEMISPGPPQST